jgi:hypothetical protein
MIEIRIAFKIEAVDLSTERFFLAVDREGER